MEFEFRVCQNPECGLRFPMQRGDRVGLRCPICLGRTLVVAERGVKREQDFQPEDRTNGIAVECVLDNVRSALNVGSIFRTAEGYGLAHLYLGGITPTPESPRVRKTGLSAERSVPWSAHRNTVELVSSLKSRGCSIWALERTSASQPIEAALAKRDSPGTRVLVVGNEQAGVDPGVLDLADEVVHLDMRGRKQSFNVAVAFAIAAHVMATK